MISKSKALRKEQAREGIAQPRAPRMFSAFAHRDFRFLMAGTFATQTGQWVQQLGKGWLVYSLTGSPLQLGLTAFFQGAGMFLFSPVAGSLADRLDRRKLMIASQFGAMLIAFLTAFLVLFDVIRVWHIYILGFVSGGLFATNNPTRQALVHDIVPREDLPNAIVLNSISANGNRIIGPSIGGVLLAVVGIHGAFFFQAGALFLAMILALQLRPIARLERKVVLSFKDSFVGGLKYVRGDKDIALILFLGLTASVLAWPYMHLLPAYTSEVLGFGEGGFGLAMSAVGVGAVSASLFMAAKATKSSARMLLVAQMSAGLLLIGLALSHFVPLSFAILAFLGCATAAQMSITQILLQTKVEDEYRGRVLSLYYLGFGMQPLATLPAGALAEQWGTPRAILVLGMLLFFSVGAVALFSKRARSL